MIVFGAIIPHSPLLLPSIGKNHREKMEATLAACKTIEEALYISRPDTICIIAPHGVHYPEAFSISLAAKYVGTLKAFGDFSTEVRAKSDYLLIDHIQREMREEGIPFTLSSTEELEYGFAVPLLLLTGHLQNWKLIPVSPSKLDGNAHYEFGKRLKQTLHGESQRVAVIASADFSHKLNPQSPAGASTEGPLFDKMMKEGLASGDTSALLSMETQIIDGAVQCAYRPIMTLLGCLEDMNMRTSVLSYEAPFGVGYLTAKYDIV